MMLQIDPVGRIAHVGPTLARLVAPGPLLAEAFVVQVPAGAVLPQALIAAPRLRLRAPDGTVLRGLAVHDGAGGALLNLSFGAGIVDAVRRHGLTEADFTPTDLTVELLYLVEAKAALTDELRRLNARVEGARARAESEAQSDALTGIGNRRALMAALRVALDRGLPFGLIHLDLDHFKAVNDTLGHAAGDHVLAQAARILSEATREGDTVARIGGDEFVLLLPSVTDVARLCAVADRLAAQLARPMAYEGQWAQVAASLGLVLSQDHPGAGAEALLARADAALYAAKRAGRARAMLAEADAPKRGDPSDGMG